ncbi:phosphatase PAP2 family protein [Candidatus Pacearchaeota archaeon]|nr:phosphatase PAP2 family protein [Candidatus Pacearchaeota archaeon]MBD3283698.1 phosphatase PAP2 family protein [Candidatus Pacearchaeota archaeon]
MKRRIIAFVIVVLVTLISFIFDKDISILIGKSRNLFLDYIFISLTFVTSALVIFFFLTTLFLWNENKRRWIIPLIFSFLLSSGIIFLIKIIFKRPRPFQEGIVSVFSVVFYFLGNSFNTWNFSFPSFQAAIVFAAFPILMKEFKKLRYFWFAFACLAAFSRVYFGVHYLSDILAGAVIGYIIGILAVFIEEKFEFGKKILHLNSSKVK